MLIKKKTYARIGLMGNPSDGFYGKTISSCISNFHAEVTLTDSPRLIIVPHKLFDCTDFSCLRDLHRTANCDGYYGGIRLIYATCKRFYDYCSENDIELTDETYAISYDTNIPRQVGLGGSSAIIVSLLKALMELYGLTEDDIPLNIQPNLVLSVETEELGINAGLQDRVIQTHGEMVFMDFDKSIMDNLGHGLYERMDPDLLPNLFLACMEISGKDSGKMHNQTRFKYNRGDKEIIEAMAKFADFACEAKEALEKRDHERFGKLMDMNLDLRIKIYGKDTIGEGSLRMIETARRLGAPVKFPGSGGAVIGMYWDEKQFDELKAAYLSQGFKFAKVKPQKSSLSI